MHEEHEREVAHKIEQETQVERPPQIDALKRKVDDRLPEFVRTGSLEQFVQFSLAYDRIVKKAASARQRHKRHPWAHLRVTTDFIDTIARPSPATTIITCGR